MSFAITSYGALGSGDVQIICAGGITGSPTNGLAHKMITIAGFSGTDSNGFDTSLMNGTWYCTGSATGSVNLEMSAPLDHSIGGVASGPTLTVGSYATVEGFFVDGWVPPGAIAGGGVGGFFMGGWVLPTFLSIQSPYFFNLIGSIYPTEGQIFPTGQVGDNDYITVEVKN